MVRLVRVIQCSERGKGGQETYAPQRAMRVVANWKEVEKGARIIEPAKTNCEIPHAVVISIWYRPARLEAREAIP